MSQSTKILLLSGRSTRFLLIVDLLSLFHQLALLGSRRLLVPSHPEKSSRPLTWSQKLPAANNFSTWKTALRKFESLADGLSQLICGWRPGYCLLMVPLLLVLGVVCAVLWGFPPIPSF